MTDKIHYVLVSGGEVSYEDWAPDPKRILSEAQLHVQQYICDFLRHTLPIKVTPELEKRFDVRVYALATEEQGIPERLDLPFQEWVDQFYQNLKNEAVEDLEREYKSFLRLREKWEARYRRENGIPFGEDAGSEAVSTFDGDCG